MEDDGSLDDNLIPIITTIELNTSEKEWTASLTIALEWEKIPANNLNKAKKVFPIMEIIDTLLAVLVKSFFIFRWLFKHFSYFIAFYNI